MTSTATQRRIVLGMPGYGKQTSAAGRAFWRATRDQSEVLHYYQNGSLLACNFNQLWCQALNIAHAGEQVDYFAMLHDDIGAEDFWLDKLIDELEANSLDVLGVVVPIKDTRGITSLALHGEDNWMPGARLSMHDVFELPETFTSDDLGGKKLLLNTGCWVAKWNQEWAKTVHFEINDRIVFNDAAGRYQAQTEPEDWHFSRQLHEIGRGPTAHLRPLRIGATRKVAVAHRGELDFTNLQPWGSSKFDVEGCQVSPVPGAFPYDIDGWLHPSEGKALAELARGKRVLEIGSYCGLSTVCMARTAEHVTTVDYFDGRGTAVQQDTRAKFDASLKRHGVAHKVEACHPDAEFPLSEYDLAFIDGAHDYESVAADIRKALAVLAPDGLIAFHDYRSPIDPGVTEAVDELLDDGGELLSTTATVAVVRPPARIPLEV
jgi:SAM-dependent methyltransferase